MQIDKQQLASKFDELKKKINSLYAREQALKLRGPNRDQRLIEQQQLALKQLQDNLAVLQKLQGDIK